MWREQRLGRRVSEDRDFYRMPVVPQGTPQKVTVSTEGPKTGARELKECAQDLSTMRWSISSVEVFAFTSSEPTFSKKLNSSVCL